MSRLHEEPKQNNECLAEAVIALYVCQGAVCPEAREFFENPSTSLVGGQQEADIASI